MSIPAVNWAVPKEDKAGLTTQYCTFTVGENTYKVTIQYSKKEYSGYKGDMDAAMRKVIEQTRDIFPDLVGTTISFNLNSDDDNDTVIKKHPNPAYAGKKLSEIENLNEELYDNVKEISDAFYNVFKGLKKQTVEASVSKAKKPDSNVLDLPPDMEPFDVNGVDEDDEEEEEVDTTNQPQVEVMNSDEEEEEDSDQIVD